MQHGTLVIPLFMEKDIRKYISGVILSFHLSKV